MAEKKEKRRLSLSSWILISIVAGVVCGLFFGERAGQLQVFGDAFIGLLQMTVLPYIVVSLISGIGKLSAQQSKLLVSRVAIIILGLWLLSFAAVIVVSLAYPAQQAASFFSSSIVEEPASFDFLGLFIPANPFKSLVDNKVPAVVLFCILLGISLMSMKRKGELLGLLDLVAEALSKMTKMIVALSPFGVFFIVAAAAGTMSLSDLGRIQGYMITASIAVFGLGFGVLPALVAVFTPFSYRDVAPLLRSSFMLAFATGKTLVVLPMLIDGIQELFEEKGYGSEETTSTIEVLIPLGYSFPHMGKLLATIFIPFAAWYMGTPLTWDQYPVLIGAGFFAHFSSATLSIPFLLDLMRIPADTFQLFMVTGVYVGRLADGIGATYLLALTVLGTCAVRALITLQWRKLGLIAAGTLVACVVVIGGARIYLNWASTGTYEKDKVLATMQLLEDPISAQIVEPGPNPVPLDSTEFHLDRIRERGVVRIGFFEDALPFSYYNGAGDLVGFDIDMMHQLARELGVTIEFVPITSEETFDEQLAADHFDIAVGGFGGTIERSQRTPFSEPYLFVTMAFVVPDHLDKTFSSIESINNLDNLKIGVLDNGWFLQSLSYYFPSAEIVVLDSPRSFLEGQGAGAEVDVLLYNAEAGAAWTLVYPRYQVATPLPRVITMPLVYPYAGQQDSPMDELLDHWVLLKTNDGTVERLYDHWILGKGAEQQGPRWSILRDVLHFD